MDDAVTPNKDLSPALLLPERNLNCSLQIHLPIISPIALRNERMPDEHKTLEQRPRAILRGLLPASGSGLGGSLLRLRFSLCLLNALLKDRCQVDDVRWLPYRRLLLRACNLPGSGPTFEVAGTSIPHALSPDTARPGWLL
jgi:hypothetical protein